MKEFNITIESDIKISFDEESEEFKALFANYLEHFDKNADYESFCENIASIIARYGVDEFIEGVGYLKLNGENQMIFENGEYKEQHSIVNIEADVDLNSKIDFEVLQIREE